MVGENVQLYSGETKRVVQKLARPGPELVYNIEVLGEHVYHVTTDGVLVHNACQHDHHIVMKGKMSGWKEENRKFVTEAQELLTNHGIDFVKDSVNRVSTLNQKHSIAYAKKVRDTLMAAANEATKDRKDVAQAIRDKLGDIARDISSGKFYEDL